MVSQSRPEPMNATPHHAKVRTVLRFANTQFIAGENVSGKMEMECKADKGLGISVIMVELFATEELTSRDHSATQTFLRSRRIFQGPGLPPSNSVHPHPLPGEPSLPLDYYSARKGTTTFLFRIPLPETSPSSISFASGLAQVRYEVRATVGVAWKGERVLVTDKKQVDVVERFDQTLIHAEPEGVVVGENGKFWAQGKVVGGAVIAGQPACLELTVKNHSAKKSTGLTLSLIRNLHLSNIPSSQKQPLQITDTLTSVSYRGPEYMVPPGAEGVASLVFDVPENARSAKGGKRDGGEEQDAMESLFEVHCTINVKISMGFGSKDIYLDIPVAITQPIAFSAASTVSALYPPLTPANNIPRIHSPDPQALYYPPTSPNIYPIHSPLPHGYPLPSMSPPILPYVDQGRVWLPPPSTSPLPYPYYPAQPPQQYIYYPTLPPPLPASIVRPSSAQPVPSQPLYHTGPEPLPSFATQPLIPLHTGGPSLAEREEGKGERASRITHHLRMSSRHRSVSPQAHRYTQPSVPASHTQNLVPFPKSSSPASQSTPPTQGGHSRNLRISLNATGGDVISPRPLLSPKQSFSVDPITQATISKSERVETLERIAAEVNKANADMSGPMPDLELDKTLPGPPVPSGKPTSPHSDPRPRADAVFAGISGSSPGNTPPTPALAAYTSSKASRAALGVIGGLDALEARLLAEVGTKKVERTETKPDVRSVMPIDIPRPVDPDPADDSAISSLALPGLGGDEITLRLGKGSPSGYGSERENKSAGKVAESPKEAGKRSRKGALTKDKPDEKKEKELHRLRKAAQGRVTAWLDSIDPEVPPQMVTPPPESPLPIVSGMGSKGASVLAGRSVATNINLEGKAIQDSSVEAEPNARSSGFMPFGTYRAERAREATPDRATPKVEQNIKKQSPKAAPLLLPYVDPQSKYDVRSARGGRGGQVTAIASIWASAAQANSKPMVGRSAKTTPRPPSARPVSKPPTTTSPVLAQLASSKPAWLQPKTATATPAAHRNKGVKASSVPAILSSSLATPMLSSTASLARPSTKPSPVFITPPNTDMKTSVSAKLLAPKAELAFGQARLRELIRKYQG